MKIFEYTRVAGTRIMINKSISLSELNCMGIDGWELITFTWIEGKLAFAYFKREKLDQQEI